LNPEALHQLVGQVINDLGAANGALIILGFHAALAALNAQPV
jgi:hypothetical protein